MKLKREEEIDEDDLDDMVADDYTKDRIKEKVQRLETSMKVRLDNLDKNPSVGGTNAFANLIDKYLKLMDWLDKHPDEPKDINTARDFKRFQEVVSEFVTPEGMDLLMQLYVHRYGTDEEKAELKSIIKDGAFQKQVERFRNRTISKWHDKLPRWLS